MSRVVVFAVLAWLVFAAPANAAVPIALRYDTRATEVALAGPDVLVASELFSHPMRLLAIPRTGGPPRTLLTVRKAEADTVRLAASAQRVAVAVDTQNQHRVYSGPPSGPLRLVRHTRDSGWTPETVDVDGDRMLLVEYKPENSSSGDEDEGGGTPRASILDGSGWTRIRWASGKRAPVAIAGRYAATVASGPKRIEVVELATGKRLYAVKGSFYGAPVDLLADGRIVAGMRGSVVLGGPGQPQRTLAGSKRLGTPRFADAAIAALDDVHHTLALVGGDGARTTLGPPSFDPKGLAADARGVAWVFNGCLRYAALASGAAAGSSDPCPQTEILLYGVGAHDTLHGNHARVLMKCVAAARGRCRGELLLREGPRKPVLGRGGFSLRPSTRDVRVTIHFTAAAVAKFQREHSGYLIVDPRVRDGTASGGGGGDFEFDVEVGSQNQ